MNRFYLIMIFCCSFGDLFAQDLSAKIHLNCHQTPLPKVLEQISRQTDIVFSFTPLLVHADQKVNFVSQNTSIQQALVQILSPFNIAYTQRHQYIILRSQLSVQANKPQPSPSILPNKPTLSLPDTVKHAVYHKIDPLKNILLLRSGDSSLICHSVISNQNNAMMLAKNSEKDERTKMPKVSFQFRNQITLALALLGVVSVSAQNEVVPKAIKTPICAETSDRPAQLSFVNFVGTDFNASARYNYMLSVNLLSGTTGGVQGVEFGGILNINKGEMSGVQFSGIANYNNCTVSGVQFAGALNHTRDASKGIQLAGWVNNAEYGGKVQIAGLINRSNSGKSELQLSGFANLADTAKIQIGVLNAVNKGRFQLGLINLRDTADGIMIGVLNLARKGGIIEIDATAGFAQLLESTLSLRTGTDRFYSILSIGHTFENNSLPEIWATGLGIGTSLQHNKHFKTRLEAIHFTLFDKNFRSNAYNCLTQIRPLLHYQVSQSIKLFGGPSLNLYVSNNLSGDSFQIDAPYTLFENKGDKTKVQAWIGAQVGIGFCF